MAAEEFDGSGFNTAGLHRLHVAIETGSRDEIKALVSKDTANLPTRDGYRWTPLHYAAYSGTFCTSADLVLTLQCRRRRRDGQTFASAGCKSEPCCRIR